LVEQALEGQLESLGRLVRPRGDLPPDLLDPLVADLGQLADVVEHLAQGGDLDMIARRTGVHRLTGIDAECSQSRVDGLRALRSPSAVDFHRASQTGAGPTVPPPADPKDVRLVTHGGRSGKVGRRRPSPLPLRSPSTPLRPDIGRQHSEYRPETGASLI